MLDFVSKKFAIGSGIRRTRQGWRSVDLILFDRFDAEFTSEHHEMEKPVGVDTMLLKI